MKKNSLSKIIIDTDAGHDDALAMMLLLKSSLFNTLAITTVAGNSTIENATRNAQYILNLLNRSDISIHSGKPKPLKRKLVQAVVHGESGLDGVDTTKTQYKLTDDADEKIIELIKKFPHEITILTLGPLTNVARAFTKNVEIPALIKQIVIMGGAINVCGNKNRVAEFNMFVDPEAADIVFKSSTPKVLVPLDPCNNIPLFLPDFYNLKNSPLYLPLMRMMKKFIEGIEKYEGTKGALVYDAIAAYYLINPTAFISRPMDIVIETKGEHTSGMTVVEKREKEKRNYNVEVVMSVNKEEFKNDFVKIIKK